MQYFRPLGAPRDHYSVRLVGVAKEEGSSIASDPLLVFGMQKFHHPYFPEGKCKKRRHQFRGLSRLGPKTQIRFAR